MQVPFITRKSGGVAVAPAVHRLIQQGNAARNRRAWDESARAYRQALQARPDLAHIWIQLGHSLKEGGALDEAERAYRRATELVPEGGEAWVHLGHVATLRGDVRAAGGLYVKAFQTEPDHPDAITELQRVLTRANGIMREVTVEMLRATLPPEEGVPSAPPFPGDRTEQARRALDAVIAEADERDRPALRQASAILAGLERDAATRAAAPPVAGRIAVVFDASDLISYFGHERLPTGIQRVQIEAIMGALAMGDHQVQVCCFVDGHDYWTEVPISQFRHMAELSVREGGRRDPAWLAALTRLHVTLLTAKPLAFPRGGYLVNLGTSWWMQNYFMYVRQAKVQYGIRYVPFVHDFIPIMAPSHCLKNLIEEFISWSVGVFAHADHYLVNSEATKRDLFKVAGILGGTVDPEDIAVIPLNADFRSPGGQSPGHPPATRTLADWGLQGQRFVLMVGTVESRKGHTVAMDAWLALLQRHRPQSLPLLVCVGRRGWLNGDVYERLDRHELLARQVRMLSDLSDADLALLYQNCLFTIYPSFYEGWGLPITEALCYGKPVITTDNSSLPEAGGSFAVYVETGSVTALAAAVERMSFETAYREEIAARIVAEFRPRSWHAVAAQIDGELTRLAARDTGSAPAWRAPTARLGVYYPLARSVAMRLWPGLGSGEVFRAGFGWHWPDRDGCWTRPEGGDLAIGLPEGVDAVTVYLLLRGLPDQDCAWTLTVPGQPAMVGRLRARDRRLAALECRVPRGPDRTLHLRLVGSRADMVLMRTGEITREQPASVGLAGFAMHETGDAAARLAVLEAVAFGRLDRLDAYREPGLLDDDDAPEPWELAPATRVQVGNVARPGPSR